MNNKGIAGRLLAGATALFLLLNSPGIFGAARPIYSSPSSSANLSIDSRVIQILVQHPELTHVLVNYLRVTGDYVPSRNDIDTNGRIKLDDRLLLALVKRPEAVDIILNYNNNEAVRRAASRRSGSYKHPSYIFKHPGLVPIPR
ncbi:uncharacterized protein [Lepeophtheirus salmonis]|nr:uncharacterized protein LOC121121287 [Lepeophtheirus salmonis]